MEIKFEPRKRYYAVNDAFRIFHLDYIGPYNDSLLLFMDPTLGGPTDGLIVIDESFYWNYLTDYDWTKFGGFGTLQIFYTREEADKYVDYAKEIKSHHLKLTSVTDLIILRKLIKVLEEEQNEV
ncbi:MAG: hypothetical protein R3321_03620 [Nitrososphaeraceae archaeon]|nr:hypothetical protein [Nitrososphaeraceae archaeon]